MYESVMSMCTISSIVGLEIASMDKDEVQLSKTSQEFCGIVMFDVESRGQFRNGRSSDDPQYL